MTHIKADFVKTRHIPNEGLNRLLEIGKEVSEILGTDKWYLEGCDE